MAHAKRVSAADLLCDLLVGAFALWTLLANVTVLSGGSLDRLLVGAACVGGPAVLLGCWLLVRRRKSELLPETPLPERSLTEPALWQRAALILSALVVVALYAFTKSASAFWVGAMAVLVLLCLRELDRRPLWPSLPTASGRSARLLLLAVLCALAALFLQRPDEDDAVYVNIAVAAADHPGRALFGFDSLHGLGDALPMLSVYELQSLELWNAAVARLSGLAAIDVAHFAVPLIAAFLLPLAHARLLRLLVPRRWFAALLAVLAFLLLAANTRRGYGSFSLVHLQHGKAIFVSVAVPLLYAYSLELARAPSPLRWLRLAAAQIAAVGLTSSALWAAPAVAGLGLLAGTALRGRSLLALLGGLAASIYPLGLALWLRGQLGRAALSIGEQGSGDAPFAEALRTVIGEGAVALLMLACVLGTWGVATTAVLRRFALVVPLGFFLLLWNPNSAPLLAEQVTGVPTFWRVFWVLPLPTLVGIVLTAPLLLEGGGAASRWWRRAGLALGAALLIWGPGMHPLPSENRVHIGWPGRRVPARAFAAARAVVEHAPAGSSVLAPPSVSTWIPTLHEHPYPLIVRTSYASTLRDVLGAEETERRLSLTSLAAGTTRVQGAGSVLQRAIEDYRLAAVCLASPGKLQPTLPRALRSAGFEKVMQDEDYVVWARSEASGQE